MGVLSRRKALGLTGSAVALGAWPSRGKEAQAQSLTKVRVALAWVPNVEYAGLWIAIQEGYFAQERLEIEYQPGGPNASPALVAVSAGKADIGYAAWLPFLDAVAKGNDFVLFAATLPRSPLGILSLAAKPILAAKDLVGAKLLVQDLNGRTAIQAVLKLNDLPLDWKEVPAGYSPEPLLGKQGEGYVAFETNQLLTLEQMGMKRGKDFHFVSFDDLGFRTFAGGLFASRSYLKDHRAAVVGFYRALARGWARNQEDPGYAARLVVEKYGRDLGLNLEQQRKQNEIQIGLMKAGGPALLALDEALLSGPMSAAAKASGRTNLPEIGTIADFNVAREAR